MTDKTKLFCKYYASISVPDTNGNGTQSAIKAGFSVNGAKQKAYELLQRDDVKRELEEIYNENCSLIDLTPIWVKDQCYIMYNKCKDRGDIVSARAFLDLAGKCVGAYINRQTEQDIDIEPVSANDKRQALMEEIRLLDELAQAGDGLPGRG